MLLKKEVLDRIVGGEISLIFRRWKRPTVRSGGTLQTAIGVLAIVSVEPASLGALTPAEARRAGYASPQELLQELERWPEGTLYRIELRFQGVDPRIALREQDDLSADEVVELQSALARLDRRATTGPWTEILLRTIARNPELRAADLAALVRIDKERLKLDVRKLKNLGLTESLHPGYRLAPRGRELLKSIDNQKARKR